MSRTEFTALYGAVLLFWIFIWEIFGWGLSATRNRHRRNRK